MILVGDSLYGAKAFLTKEFDYRRGLPDEALLTFPSPIRPGELGKTVRMEKQITVDAGLQTAMADVCAFIDQVSNDADEYIDY